MTIYGTEFSAPINQDLGKLVLWGLKGSGSNTKQIIEMCCFIECHLCVWGRLQ